MTAIDGNALNRWSLLHLETDPEYAVLKADAVECLQDWLKYDQDVRLLVWQAEDMLTRLLGSTRRIYPNRHVAVDLLYDRPVPMLSFNRTRTLVFPGVAWTAEAKDLVHAPALPEWKTRSGICYWCSEPVRTRVRADVRLPEPVCGPCAAQFPEQNEQRGLGAWV